MNSILTIMKRHPISSVMIGIGIVISIASRNILPLMLFGAFFGGICFFMEWAARNSFLESKEYKKEMRRRKAAEELQKNVYSKKY